jgi:hypothetical protein
MSITFDTLRIVSMPRMKHVGCCLLVGILIGCGGGAPSTSNPGTAPPHQGNLVKIPGGPGYVEVVQKKAESPTATMNGEVSFYFLKEDMTPVSPAPIVGSLEVGKKKVSLKSEGDALVTPSGPPLFAKSNGVDGMLSVELDGKSTNLPLGVR